MAKKEKEEKEEKGKFGKTDIGAVRKDVTEREKAREQFEKGFTRFYTQRQGYNFLRMIPPLAGRTLPWEKSARHFNLGPNGDSFSNCAGPGCPACALSKALQKSRKESEKSRGENIRRNIGYCSQVIDVSPLYDLVDGKVKMTSKSEDFPKCWGNIEYKDSNREILCKKCANCKRKINGFGVSWADSCELGICISTMSGARIDDIAEGFDEGDFTDIGSGGRTIQIKRKGKGRFKTSYTTKVLSKEWALPKHMRKYVKENVNDLLDIVKFANIEDVKKLMAGHSANDDTPDCFGEFDSETKKCKKCELADICAEESDDTSEATVVDTDDINDADEEDIGDDADDDDDDDTNDDDDEDDTDDDGAFAALSKSLAKKAGLSSKKKKNRK